MKAQIVRVLTAPATVPLADAGQQVAETLAIGLLLQDGRVAWGDCVGAEPALGHDEALATVQRVVAPALEGQELAGFRELAAEVDALRETATVTRPRRATGEESDTRSMPAGPEGISRRALLTTPARLFHPSAGRTETEPPETKREREPLTQQVTVERPLHPALRCGLSQALLQAASLVQGRTMAQVLADEWGMDPPQVAVPIAARSTYDRHQAESAIRHRAASLPHASIDDIAAQVGADGGHLTRYLRWLVERIAVLGGEEYRPAIHLDLAGALGEITDHHPGYMLGHLHAWRMAAGPYPLRVEDPVLCQDRQAQIEALRTLRDYLRLRKIDVQVVAGRWINNPDDLAAFLTAQYPGPAAQRTGLAADMIHLQMPQLGSLHNAVEAVLACRRAGVPVLLGGSMTETDLTARTALHVALAARADLFLAWLGTDARLALSLLRNETSRALATTAACLPTRDAPDGVEI
jgi:methylaspartate ammonia-lyase